MNTYWGGVRRLGRWIVVVGAVGGVLTVANIAYAKFTGSDSARNASTSATVGVDITNEARSGQCTDMLPGDTCTMTFTAKNTGSVSEVFAAIVEQSAGAAACYDNTVALDAGTLEVGDAHSDYDAGQSGNGTLTSKLKPDAGNDCQGVPNDVGVTVNAEPSPSPRD